MKKTGQSYTYLEFKKGITGDIVDTLHEIVGSIEKEDNEYVEIGQIVKTSENNFLIIINHYQID
ncbi:hypothetical protein EEL32_24295 [Brevibacillus laterosporus]|nr:hypothetical protein [Brevibacillus laterosporus]TPG75477.1 hypothetical protein EEL32_24295 [Brevibacillus laterosporus]